MQYGLAVIETDLYIRDKHTLMDSRGYLQAVHDCKNVYVKAQVQRKREDSKNKREVMKRSKELVVKESR
jgi:hypothetical protein